MSAQSLKAAQSALRGFLIGALLASAVSAGAAEPARIGRIKYLREGKTDRISLEYEGNLQYREYRFPNGRYGIFEMEPAVLSEDKARLKPQGNFLTVIDLSPKGGSSRQRVNLQYDLNEWTTPTIYDTGSRLDITFAPSERRAPTREAAIPPADRSIPAEVIATISGIRPMAFVTEPRTSVSGRNEGSLREDVFGDYEKINTPNDPFPKRGARDSKLVAAAAQAPQKDPPASPVVLGTKPAAPIASPVASPVATSPPAVPSAAATSESANVAKPGKYEILKVGKPFVPEAGVAATAVGRVTGGRAYQPIDLTLPAFQAPVTLHFKDADLQDVI
ncbi:hypothetical protein FJY63_13445, partial [Candidatus Sumerlaeota bacterium]|nr:hypothetical protein [Candidatus Sumerlaeota bacterium]